MSRLSRPAATAVAIPLILTGLLATFWVQSGRLPLFGDEPHYVIMAASVARDADFELRNNYALEERHPRYFGPIDPHVWRVGHRWYSLHGPALGVLLAPGLEIAGVAGARLTTCALAALLPLAVFLWLGRLLGRRDALALTLVSTVSVPYVFGAVHLYPDPVAAAVFAPLLLWLAAPGLRAERPAGWAAFWLAAGLLPALMIKFLAPVALIGFFALRPGSPRRERVAERRARLASAPLLLIGPLALVIYHLRTFGNVLGPRGPGELAPGVEQAWMVFLGLHLDQAQGMFLQLPLLLAGVPALGIVAARRPRLAAAWCLLYASLIVPNALQVIPFGGASPSGRFGWPAAWLWLAPLGLALSWHRRQLGQVLRATVVCVAAYEAALAVRWLPHPMTVTNEFTPQLALRNSLFPVGMRAWLPSFYGTDWWRHPPNLAAIAVCLVLLAGGAVLGARLARSCAGRQPEVSPG